MGLKTYEIDTSPLNQEAQEKAMKFIEINAFTNAYIPGTKGKYQCQWEDSVNPSIFPALAGCVIHEVLSADMS